MNEDEAPLSEFKAINGNELLEQIDQKKLKLRRVKKINNEGDENGEEGQVLQ